MIPNVDATREKIVFAKVSVELGYKNNLSEAQIDITLVNLKIIFRVKRRLTIKNFKIVNEVMF
mgnify:CR=1 FL=1